VISGDVAQALSDGEQQLLPLGHEQVKGISTEIPIFEYRVDDRKSWEWSARAGSSPRAEIPV
jgi:hypothetical protein